MVLSCDQKLLKRFFSVYVDNNSPSNFQRDFSIRHNTFTNNDSKYEGKCIASNRDGWQDHFFFGSILSAELFFRKT